MSAFLNLPQPPPGKLTPALLALQKAATAQLPGSGFSTNMRPLRERRTAPLHPFIVSDDAPCPQNQLMVQGFEWYIPPDHQHWRRLSQILPSLSHLGVSHLWIPPACKAAHGPDGNGYDIYDLYDLGEFPQKGSTGTKWGTKEELVDLTQIASEQYGVKILFDAVLNHKTGADFKEQCWGKQVDPKDRRVELDNESQELEGWTGFEFPGRQGRYSGMKWTKEHFTGIDYDDRTKRHGVWKLGGKEWAEDVDEELGNYDFLMFADIDHRHPDVKADIFHWVKWLSRQLKIGGLRVDAIKHYSFRFLRDLLRHIDREVNDQWFIVGEYWREDSEFLAKFIEFMDHRISLFDVQLVSNFSRISLAEEKGDLRKLLDDTLALWKPDNAVTFVVNHDTQNGQSLETPVLPFFIPLAYAVILLRANTGLPCVFYADLYGSFGPPQPNTQGYVKFTPPTSGGAILPKMMLARKLWAYGTQYDYFGESHCVGFTRCGHVSQSRGDGVAVVMTNAWECASKRMFVGRQHAGEIWTDLLKWCFGQVVIDGEGWGVFPVGPRSVSVWVNSTAEGRAGVDSFTFDFDIYGLYKQQESTPIATITR
ncbi:alpha-amylase [Podospora australis]|uniref:Alpha-amylase n=1 Tax=Podospora australis TaxID=1536484 RepID=A0AAN6WN05_9PEZI|nr:alpha-amylase [Podospora australis]